MMSNGVTSIGALAFANSGLTSVTIPGSVTNIGENAFWDCFKLTNATICDGVTSIPDEAFYECTGLASVSIPASVTNIGMAAFDNCVNLRNLTIPGSVTSIGGTAFYHCASLARVILPGSVTSIGDEVFTDCYNLTNVTISAAITNMLDYAFWSCTSLSTLFFRGDAPAADSTVFADDIATAYYLPGTTGWAEFSTITGVPTVLWNPLIQTNDGSFGLSNNQFGFNITGTTNIPIAVEACTNLAGSEWIPRLTLKLTNGLFYFSEPYLTNGSGFFYRVSSP
jgi:hypothetical protein